MLLATKIATALVLPLDLSIALGLAALLLSLRHRAAAAACGLLAVAILAAASLPLVSDALVSSLERDFPPADPAAAPAADAIVVLGGSLQPALPPRRGPELADASDRVLHAARLYRAGKAPLVVPSGGRLPWSAATRSEAREMEDLLVEWGVPREAVLREERGRTTAENAAETAKLLRPRGVRKVLLVTSSIHMRRALAAFRGAGIDAVPSPCDVLVTRSEGTSLGDVLPAPEALARTQRAMKEYLGLAVARVRS